MSNDIQFLDIDSQTIINQIIGSFEASLGESLSPTDERRMFLMNIVPIIIGIKNDINNSAKQNLLRYARNEVLDAIGEFKNTYRLQPQKASVTIRFTLSAIQGTNITVPIGTRVTPDGNIYFKTINTLVIPAGQLIGDMKCEAIESGAASNGFTPGQIKILVDPVAFISSIVNIDTSTDGTDIESDEHFKERIRQAPEGYSVAGPTGAYTYWAKTADSTIADVYVASPSPGVVKVVPLCINGLIPSQTILDKVFAIVSAKDKRPLTDNVQVSAPTASTYNIDFTYYIPIERKTEETIIRNAIEGSGGAVDKYKLWQNAALGRDINPDQLRLNILTAGASRIVLNSPAFSAIAADAVAKVGTTNIVYGGLE